MPSLRVRWVCRRSGGGVDGFAWCFPVCVAASFATIGSSCLRAVPKARGKEVDDWFSKPDYGRVPEYLSTIKSQITAEQEFVQRMLDQHQVGVAKVRHGGAWGDEARMAASQHSDPSRKPTPSPVCPRPPSFYPALVLAVQMEEEAAAGTRTRELSAEERTSMLDGLKAKWAEVNAAYQRITFRNISTHNSTLGEIRFKETCEQQMSACEEAIK